MTRAHFKFLAKNQLRGKVGTLFLASLLFSLVIIGISVVPALLTLLLALALETVGTVIGIVLSVAASIFLSFFAFPAFNIGYIMMLENIANNPNAQPRARDIFRGFKYSWPAFKVFFFIYLFTYLWSLLFVIPGLIKAYSYSQALYVLAENPGMGALEAIRRSKEMMRGRKFDFFVLWNLSFYPWFLLMPFTLGFLGIWLFPYMDLTRVNFYNHAKSVPGVPEYGIPTYGKPIPSSAFNATYCQATGYAPTAYAAPASAPAPAPAPAPAYAAPVSAPAPVAEAPQPAPVAEAPAPAPVAEAPVAEAPASETPVEETAATEAPTEGE